jgi:hypothetical protein
VAGFWVGDGPEDRVDAAMKPEAGGVAGMGEHDIAGVAWADLVDAVHIEDGDPSAAPLGFGGRRWRSCKLASEASTAWMNLAELRVVRSMQCRNIKKRCGLTAEPWPKTLVSI